MSSLVELIEFRTGDDVYRYTTRGQDRIWDGHVWTATEVTHSNISNSKEMAKNDVRFEFPLGHLFAMQYLGYGPDQPTTVVIRRNRLDDPDDFYVFWKGRASDCDATDQIITVVFQSILNSAENSGLIARMQKFCRHVVYHSGCNLDKDDFAVESSITAIDARFLTITCPDITGYAENYFAGGMILLPNSALRYITKSVGDQITLWRPAPEINELLESADPHTTTLYPGCDGSLNTCHEKFNNIDNNGAFYWIPSQNPYGGGNVY